ncbi:GDSL family lipase [Bacillus sp. AGMB 02131]|uniref:GDSL family lipase n=1 Tax=Peribacillus faecalis TaxID=2772559 RepID=A0A927HDV1_9BACI|nr:GDSL-type esterase/lipase family protein [Peribacillus faecalis]MBD3109853.1 GDSL family lipase [Peribacillus faecalis]
MKKAIILAIICCFLSACSFYRVDSVTPSEKKADGQEEQAETSKGKVEEEKPITGKETFEPGENEQQQLYVEDESAADLRVTMLGDSLTEGIGDETDNGGYRYFLSEKLMEEPSINQVFFEEYGKKGLTSAGLKKRLKEAEIVESIQKTDVVVVTIGGNDVMNVVKKNFLNLKVGDFYQAMDKYDSNVQAIIKDIRTYNEEADIYLVGIYNPFQLLLSDIQEFDILMDEWNRRSNRIVEQYDAAYFVEIWEIFEEHDENLIFEGDYFHPNTKGYERMGEVIYQSVKDNTISREQHLETE